MSVWGKLKDRYETKQPRKILSLDGGGIRGVITLEILSELENKLRKKLNRKENFRLSDYFDYIGGTSTGAIIATGLALGKSTKELLNFYDKFGEKMFDKTFLFKKFLHLYESGPLLNQLKKTFGNDTDLDLRNGKLKTLLCVVTMNRTTDSPWPVSNNPLAKYNLETRPDCNLRIKLYQLVRASSAAPVYFGPETINWDPKDPAKSFVFVDGGVTPYNNPAFLLYRMATLPEYFLNWEKGEDKLLIVSVGTGSAPSEGEYGNVGDAVVHLPGNLMYAMQIDQDINCRTVGRCTHGDLIDSELKYMISKEPLSNDTGKNFLYIRYNATLTRNGLDDLKLRNIEPGNVKKLDSVEYLVDLHLVGKAAGKQVSMDHFGSFV